MLNPHHDMSMAYYKQKQEFLRQKRLRKGNEFFGRVQNESLIQ
jgi:hypothetical protein